jgi:hypothetical protein
MTFDFSTQSATSADRKRFKSMEKDDQKNQPETQDAEKGHGLRNILKIIFLVSVLAGAWFLLDRLINGK